MGGFCEAELNGDNKWIDGDNTNQSYLRLKAGNKEMADIINSIMLNYF